MATLTAEQLFRKHLGHWQHRDGNGEIIPFSGQEHPWIAFRTYRAISWLRHAEQHAAEDVDASFIFLWIAFDASYGSKKAKERTAMGQFFNNLRRQDSSHAIYDAIWHRFSGTVRILIENESMFDPYLDDLNGDPSVPDWRQEMNRKNDEIRSSLRHRDRVFTTLDEVFSRLYALRNQLVHGGAKLGSTRNRDAVRNGRAIMAFLVPLFLDIMIDNREHLRLGEPRYYLQGEGP